MTSKLATFRIEEEDWKDFLAKADEQKTSASALLLTFVKWMNAGNTLPQPDIELVPDIDSRIEGRVLLALSLALPRALSEALPEAIAPLQAQLDELRGKPPKVTKSQKS